MCKRYFFILFVLKICTFRFANYSSMDEIEQITGLSAVNIRVLLSRARKIIREQLEKYYTYEYGR